MSEQTKQTCPHCHLPAVIPEVCTPEINAVIEQNIERDWGILNAGYDIGRSAGETPAPQEPTRIPSAWTEFGDGHDYSRTGKHDPNNCRVCFRLTVKRVEAENTRLRAALAEADALAKTWRTRQVALADSPVEDIQCAAGFIGGCADELEEVIARAALKGDAEAIAALELAEGVATGRLAEVASERDKAEAELSELRTITEPWQAVHHLAPWQCVFGAFHPVEEVEKARQAERAHYCAELTTLRDQLAAAQDALRAADHLMAENVQSMLPASGWLSWRAQHRAALDDLGSQEP